MKFSVTIPAYKSQYLDEAVRSVLSQSYKDWELIVVDDSSPEDLGVIVRPYLKDSRVRYYRNEKNCGAVNVVDNWNICLNYCTGDYVICMGDDDRLLPCCLSEYKTLIEKHPGLNVYHTQTEIIDENGKQAANLSARPEWENAICMMLRRWDGDQQYIGDFCYSRQHLTAVGGYYFLPYAWGSDDVTAFRAAMEKGIANTASVCFQYRENQHSISLSQDDAQKVEAVLLHEEWFSRTLLTLRQQGTYSEKDIAAALCSMHLFMNRLKTYHVLRDMQHGGIKRFPYWCSTISRHGLSLYTLTKLYLKSTISKT